MSQCDEALFVNVDDSVDEIEMGNYDMNRLPGKLFMLAGHRQRRGQLIFYLRCRSKNIVKLPGPGLGLGLGY